MGKAYLSLGSNIEPEANLRSAVTALRERFGEVVLSPAYRTRAVGFDGADFLNAAAIVDSDLDPFALDDWLHALEDAHGRDRSGPRFGDRPLDIDILFYDDLILDGTTHEGQRQQRAAPNAALKRAPRRPLLLPRNDLRHAFVLRPLADIAPDFVDPRSGRTLAALWAAAEAGSNSEAIESA